MAADDAAERAPYSGRLRILIVGAGIAGLTLASLLRQRGETPTIIEKHAEDATGGYMLGLLPLGGRVLNGLGLREEYLAQSVAMQNYEMYDRNGRLSKSYAFDSIVSRFGPYQGIARGKLIALLLQRVDREAIRYQTTLTALEEGKDGVAVTLSDGTRATFDLVVGADGMHSDIRRRVFGDEQTETWATGWGGWVYWTDPLSRDDATYRELWSTRWGLGLYPVKDRLGVFLAGNRDDLRSRSPGEHIAAVRKELPAGAFADALARLDPAERPFFWIMEDKRSARWHTDRVVLLGDAAAGFLPTAGVGASMAMDSAAALADELSRAEPEKLGFALSLYERRQRHRVLSAQKNSRDLARFMFVDSRVGTFLRDQAMRFYSVEALIKSITKVMTGA